LRELVKLHPVRWQWKDTTTTQLNLGLVAQEVEPVLPELLLRRVDNKGSLGLNYMGLIPVLVKGIQEQQAEIQQEQAQIRQQRQQIESLQRQDREIKAKNAATRDDNAELKTRLYRQQQEINALKKLICASRRSAKVCK
jgi:peptidoglycan hydrolase CwlO-like protein